MSTPFQRYPVELIDTPVLANGSRVLVRPVLPQDLDLHRLFFDCLSGVSRLNRFFSPIPSVPDALLEWLTLVDHNKHVALVAEVLGEQGERIVAEARYVIDEEEEGAEVGIAVADGFRRLGLGTYLLTRLLGAARRARVPLVHGQTLVGNRAMVRLARKLGFSITADPRDDALVKVSLRLNAAGTQALQST